MMNFGTIKINMDKSSHAKILVDCMAKLLGMDEKSIPQSNKNLE